MAYVVYYKMCYKKKRRGNGTSYVKSHKAGYDETENKTQSVYILGESAWIHHMVGMKQPRRGTVRVHEIEDDHIEVEK